jgi:hypothetical protein
VGLGGGEFGEGKQLELHGVCRELSPMVVSQNFSSATSLAMLAPISTLMGMPRRSPITSEMSFSPLGPSSTPWAQDGAQASCPLSPTEGFPPRNSAPSNPLFISVPPQMPCSTPTQPKLAARRVDSSDKPFHWQTLLPCTCNQLTSPKQHIALPASQPTSSWALLQTSYLFLLPSQPTSTVPQYPFYTS